MQSCHINSEVLELVSNLSETRRYLHMHPELSLKEFKTSEFICKFLEEYGLKVITKVGHPTGLVGILTGEAGPGPCILFRADIDGLPIKDIKEVEYKSQNENVLHACGHDGHMTSLLYAAKILSKNKHKLKGHIKFCFEPGEEVGKGSKAMIEDPVYPVLLSEPKVDFCFGFHFWTQFKTGIASVKPGVVSSIINSFKIKVEGKAAHGAMPNLGIDSIVIMNQLISSLQTIVSRNLNPKEFAVLTIGMIKGGTAPNVIASECEIAGTTRAFDKQTNDTIIQRIQLICKGIQEQFECKVEFTIDHYVPAIVNTEQESKIVLSVLQEIFQSENIDQQYQINGSEDFAYFLQQTPGAYAFIGAALEETIQNGEFKMSHHVNNFDLNEECLPIGTSYWIQLAYKYLS